MIISDNVMIGESILPNAQKILENIQEDKHCGNPFWYVITTAWEEENLMNILSGMELRHPFYHTGSLRILGLAGSRKEALELVLKLVQNGYDKEEIFNLKHFFEQF